MSCATGRPLGSRAGLEADVANGQLAHQAIDPTGRRLTARCGNWTRCRRALTRIVDADAAAGDAGRASRRYSRSGIFEIRRAGVKLRSRRRRAPLPVRPRRCRCPMPPRPRWTRCPGAGDLGGGGSGRAPGFGRRRDDRRWLGLLAGRRRPPSALLGPRLGGGGGGGGGCGSTDGECLQLIDRACEPSRR